MFISAFLLSLVAWWLATGVVLTLVQLQGNKKFSAFGLLTSLTLGAIILLTENVHASTLWDVTIGFFLGLLIWAWLETSYLMGYVTGPNKNPLPDNQTEIQRFVGGVNTSLYHEISIIIAVVILGFISMEARNPVAFHTALILWLMRWSTKLNLFLGTQRFNSDWLPANLRHTVSYIKTGTTTTFGIISLVCCLSITYLLFTAAGDSEELYQQYSYLLMTGLAGLGTLEHLFLMLPMKEEKLWRWFKRNAPN